MKYFNNDFFSSSNTFEENLQAAKAAGFTHTYRWINSDLEWLFFAKSFDQAESEAVSLYMSEKKVTDCEFASKYYSEFIDINEIDDLV